MGYLRKAVKQDIDLLFEWVNEEAVRKNAFSTGRISYDEHQKWFENLLAREDAGQYIFEQEDEPVGQIRVCVNDDEAEIDYSICKEKRGLGYGKEMLRLLAERIKQDFPKVKKLTAKVKPDNTASQKVFLDMGYAEKYRFYELEVDRIGNG